MGFSTLLTASLSTTLVAHHLAFNSPYHFDFELSTMPRADPIVKKGVYNGREKIIIDGLTATRGHHQMLKRQRMNKKFRDKAKAKRQTAGKAIDTQAQ